MKKQKETTLYLGYGRYMYSAKKSDELTGIDQIAGTAGIVEGLNALDTRAVRATSTPGGRDSGPASW